MDGVDANLKMAGLSEEDFARWDALLMVFLKLCASATHIQQHADKMPTFHTIKVPDEALRTVTQIEFDQYCEWTVRALDGMAQHLQDTPMFMEFAQAIAILVYIILPKQTPFQVTRVWTNLGFYGSLELCLANSASKPSDAQLEYIRAKVHGPQTPLRLYLMCLL